jgi:hypothetical protein
MTKTNKKWPIINQCIYCGNIKDLTDEHVLPYGLGGKIQLLKASCKSCAKITGNLEQKLLRGHWWPYRKMLGLKTRSKSYPAYQPVKIKRPWGEPITAKVPIEQYSVVIVLDFDPPSILVGQNRIDYPFAPKTFAKLVGSLPTHVLIDGRVRLLESYEQIEFSVNLDARDLAQFLAKVAHGYAIYMRGLNACDEYFLPNHIIGSSEGLLTYVGSSSSTPLGSCLPGTEVNALLDRVQGEYLSVYIQLFRDGADQPPIYEVIVGRLRTSFAV